MPFSKDFMWGVSTSAYQIEGAPSADGKGPSIWDVFCRRPGRIFQGHTGDAACDHYRRYAGDVALMKALGLNAYRFSLSWPRILPEGEGAVNARGLDFYNRLIDALLEAGIEPLITLYHWDLPHELHLRGGWMNADSARWFADFARVAADAFSDRVRFWNTLEEPCTYIIMGYRTGEHAPGWRLPVADVLQAGHHTLLAHGDAVRAIRERARTPPTIGCDATASAFVPLTESPADIAAARAATFAFGRIDAWGNSRATDDDLSLWVNCWWGDPVYLGRYPEEALRVLGDRAPKVRPGDMERIAAPVDQCQLSVYGGKRCRAGADGRPEPVPYEPGYATTTQNHWAVEPGCIYWSARFMHERYGRPILIAENGHQNLDSLSPDGRVRDPQRADYLARVLPGLQRAVDEGLPVSGYFHWTLMDNFEWAEGYNIRVGLVHTDFRTQTRTPKDSFEFYRRAIAHARQTGSLPPAEASRDRQDGRDGVIT
jgi:beta-glucosidase